MLNLLKLIILTGIMSVPIYLVIFFLAFGMGQQNPAPSACMHEAKTAIHAGEILFNKLHKAE